MRLVIGVLPDTGSVSRLTDDLMLLGCPANQYLILSNDGQYLSAKRANKPSFASLGQYESVCLWGVHEPYYYTGRVRDIAQQREQSIVLIDRLVASGIAGAWQVHRDHVADGRPVSILHLNQLHRNQSELMCMVLAHATRRMQISDLVEDIEHMP